MFEELYSDEGRLEQFMNAMTGVSAGPFHALAEKFDFSKYQTLCDVGGATGQLSIILANRHPHLHCTTFDLPAVEPIATAHDQRRRTQRPGARRSAVTSSSTRFPRPTSSRWE